MTLARPPRCALSPKTGDKRCCFVRNDTIPDSFTRNGRRIAVNGKGKARTTDEDLHSDGSEPDTLEKIWASGRMR